MSIPPIIVALIPVVCLAIMFIVPTIIDIAVGIKDDEVAVNDSKQIHESLEESFELTQACNRVREQLPIVRAQTDTIKLPTDGEMPILEIDGGRCLYTEILAEEDIALAQTLDCSYLCYPITGHVLLFEPTDTDTIRSVRDVGFDDYAESVMEQEFTDEQFVKYREFAEAHTAVQLPVLLYLSKESPNGPYFDSYSTGI